MEISIVPLIKELIPFVYDVFKQNIEVLHGGNIISENEWNKYLLGEYTDPCEANFIVLAEQEPAAWLKINGLDGDVIGISMLVVDITYQRQGVGSFAIKYAEEYAKSHDKSAICIQTTKDNTAATQCYLKQGYEIVREMRYVVGDGVLRDGYEFRKNFLRTE